MRKQGVMFLLMIVLLGACSKEGSISENEESNYLFTLISPEYSGVDFKNPIVETEEQNHLVNDMLISGAGVVVGDINNDGLPDLFFTGNQVQDRLYLNKGGLKFEDITEKSQILQELIWSTGATMADVNNDGFMDIYVCKYVQGNLQLSENLLYINNGDLTFTERAKEYRLADRGFSVQANFIDVNLDGYLDVFILNQPTSVGKRQGRNIVIPRHERGLYTDRLYINTSGGQFLEITGPAGVSNLAFGLSATAGDLNNDNYVDLYVANDYELPDHVYINQNDGSYKNKANSSLKHMSNFSMGSDIADFDNDGFLDIVVVDMVAEDHVRIKTHMGGMDPDVFWNMVNKGYHYQYMFNTLQRNNGDATFSEIGHLAGISNTDWSWSALFSDFDNDGNKDLFITNGVRRAMRNSDLNNTYFAMMDSLEYVATEQGKTIDDVLKIMEFVNLAPIEKLKNYIYKNNGDFTFTKKSDEWGLGEETLSYGAAYADLDLDGDEDIIINNTDEYAYIYRNNAIEQNLGNYLNVNVLNEHGSPFYGTKVKIYKEDKFWQLVELTNVRGYKSKSEDIAHFGLGDEESISKLEVIYPTGKVQELLNVAANQLITVNVEDASERLVEEVSDTKLFNSLTGKLKITYRHQENEYDDYGKEILLPHKMSNFGPCLSVGDINSDGLEDFFVGGASGYAGVFYLQQAGETFIEYSQPQFEKDKVHEDMHSELFDYDSDGDLDLYVVSGGNEFEPDSEWLIDRLYINDGKGNFSKSKNIIPENLVSGSVIESADYDNDGDLDLFVGGRLIPGKYPFPASSFILENKDGKYIDVTQKLAPFMTQFGLVTSANWTDLDGDKLLDLVVVGEWMPVTILMNKSDGFVNTTEANGLAESAGWYYSVISADFDADGDQDLMAGNLGLNYKYKASIDHPFEVYSDDLDGNGVNDIVLGYYEHGEIFPVRGKSCSSQQMPSLGERVESFDEFANSNIFDLYGSSLEKAIHYKAFNFASVYIENLGNNEFKVKPLDNNAQFSSVNSIIPKDFNGDGILDIVISGNLYPAEIETPRNDAGMGLYLEGDGKGNFNPVHISESGFFAPNDAKDMKLINIGRDGQQAILVGNNQSYLQAIGFKIQNEKKAISMRN